MLDINDAENCLFDVCSLQNLVVYNYNPPTPTADIQPGIGIELCLTDASFQVISEFQIQSIKGHAQISLSGISLAAVLTLEKGSDDELVVSLVHCSVDIESVYSYVIDSTDEDFADSSRSDFYKAISDYFGDRVHESVSTTMCNRARLLAEIIPNYLRTMDGQLRFLGLTMDSRLVRKPIVRDDYVELALSGRVSLLKDNEVTSLQPPINSTQEFPSSQSSMVVIYVSQFVINTFSYALFRSKWLSINVTNVSFPLEYHHLLDTTCDEDEICLGTALPHVAKKYPNVSATLIVEASQRPSIHLSESAARINATFHITIVVPQANNSEASVAKMSVYVGMSAKVFISGNRFMGRVYDPKVFISAEKASSKEFVSDFSRWRNVLLMIADFVILPLLNYHGAVGLPLENLFGPGIRLLRHGVSLSTDAFILNADIAYDTPKDQYTQDWNLLMWPSQPRKWRPWRLALW